MLVEVAPLGLAIYGLGWDRFGGQGDDERFARLLPHWKGVLPKDDIAALYSSAQVPPPPVFAPCAEHLQ
jgi:hypothetical protein